MGNFAKKYFFRPEYFYRALGGVVLVKRNQQPQNTGAEYASVLDDRPSAKQERFKSPSVCRRKCSNPLTGMPKKHRSRVRKQPANR